MITVLVISAVVLALAIAVESHLNVRQDASVQVSSGQAAGTPAPLTMVAADSILNATPTPEAAVTPEPVATQAPFEYLPVYSKADTDVKMIAITIDDCSNLNLLKTAAEAAEKYDAKLTLFPLGSNIMKTNVSDAMRTCVLELGYQVENYTWSSQNLFRLGSGDMALEIWAPDMAMDYVLNKDYGMHLLRPRGGTGLKDARTHAYLKQLGYDGFVTWTQHATDVDIEKLKSSLTPGGIYAFSTTKGDIEELVEFMAFVQSREYRMVTLNELLGYPANACEDTTEDILARTMPMLEEVSLPEMSYKVGDRAWQVMVIQSRLAELGYLDPRGCDGVYGTGTSEAIIAFQAEYGLPCTGVASVEIQELLFSSDAKRASSPVTPAPQ